MPEEERYRKQEILGRTNRLFSFDTTRIVYKATPPTILLFLCVFVAAGTCLSSRCLTQDWRNAYYIDTQTDGRDLVGIATSYGLDDRGVGVRVQVGS
jgi:low affinity Fe/Cu permease